MSLITDSDMVLVSNLDTPGLMFLDMGNTYYEQVLLSNPEYGLRGKSIEETRDILNGGLFNNLLWEAANLDNSIEMAMNKEADLVGLTAVGMRFGVTFHPTKKLSLLRRLYTDVLINSGGFLPTTYDVPALIRRGLEIAVDHYKNDGTSYNFHTPRCALAGCDKAEDELGDGVILMKCGKCRETYYCGRDCQKLHWKQAHKKLCRVSDASTEKCRWEFANNSLILGGRLAKRDRVGNMVRDT